jgi:hypothetical protein
MVAIQSAGTVSRGIAVAPNALVAIDSTIAEGLAIIGSGVSAPGEIVFRDPAADIAVVSTGTTRNRVALADSEDVVPGTELIALAGSDAQPSFGTVLSMGPARWQSTDGAAHEATLLEVRSSDGTLVPGSPLFTGGFDLAGIFVFREGDSNFAIAAQTIRQVLVAAEID